MITERRGLVRCLERQGSGLRGPFGAAAGDI